MAAACLSGRREGCQNPVPSGCRSVVLVHQAAEPIPTVHRRTGNWTPVRLDRLRGTSAERAVRPLTVVVLNEHAQDPLEVTRSEDQQPVETLHSDGAHETLGVGVGPRRPKGGEDHPDSLALEDLRRPGNFESRSWIRNLVLSSGVAKGNVACLLSDPTPARLRGAAGELDPPALKLDEEQHVVAA